MAEGFDPKSLPELLQAGFSVSLGAFYKSFEMMKSPQDAAVRMVDEMKELLTVPPEAGEGVQQKAEAVAGRWVNKGVDWLQSCKTAGEKLTENR
jgi:hypothetical protein